MAKFREINRPLIVEAIEIVEPTIFIDGTDEQSADVGDWEVRYADGRREILKPLDFRKRFEPYDIDDEIRDISDATIAAFQSEEQLEAKEFIQNLRESGIHKE